MDAQPPRARSSKRRAARAAAEQGNSAKAPQGRARTPPSTNGVSSLKAHFENLGNSASRSPPPTRRASVSSVALASGSISSGSESSSADDGDDGEKENGGEIEAALCPWRRVAQTATQHEYFLNSQTKATAWFLPDGVADIDVPDFVGFEGEDETESSSSSSGESEEESEVRPARAAATGPRGSTASGRTRAPRPHHTLQHAAPPREAQSMHAARAGGATAGGARGGAHGGAPLQERTAPRLHRELDAVSVDFRADVMRSLTAAVLNHPQSSRRSRGDAAARAAESGDEGSDDGNAPPGLDGPPSAHAAAVRGGTAVSLTGRRAEGRLPVDSGWAQWAAAMSYGVAGPRDAGASTPRASTPLSLSRWNHALSALEREADAAKRGRGVSTSAALLARAPELATQFFAAERARAVERISDLGRVLHDDPRGSPGPRARFAGACFISFVCSYLLLLIISFVCSILLSLLPPTPARAFCRPSELPSRGQRAKSRRVEGREFEQRARRGEAGGGQHGVATAPRAPRRAHAQRAGGRVPAPRGNGAARSRGRRWVLFTVTFYANHAHNLTRSP